MILHIPNNNKLFACTKLEEVQMHLTVSLLHLSGGKDEQEGPAAVKRILREHRQAKGKIMRDDSPHPPLASILGL